MNNSGVEGVSPGVASNAPKFGDEPGYWSLEFRVWSLEFGVWRSGTKGPPPCRPIDHLGPYQGEKWDGAEAGFCLAFLTRPRLVHGRRGG
jgi:hypothetical protein